MDTSPHATQQLAQTLRTARIARGLSQRDLAQQAGLGQNRLALIEAGRVDLRASTLVQLARALDLELVLTPRRVLPAVQSLAQSRPSEDPGRRSVRGTPTRALRRIQQHVTAIERDHAASKDLAQVKSTTQVLLEAGPNLPAAALQPLRRSARWLALARANKEPAQPLLARVAAQLQELRRTLPAPRLEQASQTQRAAYSLEDEIS